jgi:hypothetical protein
MLIAWANHVGFAPAHSEKRDPSPKHIFEFMEGLSEPT